MKRAIGYARISDDDQSRWSITGQQDLIREHCQKSDIELIAIFTDEGESAKNFDRANWKELESFVRHNHRQVDYLFVMAYTRFSRNTGEALKMIEELENRYGIRVLSITEPLHMHPDSPYFHYIRTQIIHNGELELRIIRDRTRFGIFNAQKAGRYVTRPPKGYKRDKDGVGNPTIIVDPNLAPAIREAFDRFVSGETIISIRNILKAQGVHIKGNSDLQAILQHPAYMGYIRQIAYYDAPEALVRGIHEPIVSEDTWWKAQYRFTKNSLQQRSVLNADFPLRGVLKCFCSRYLTAARSKGRNNYYGYYKCNSHTAINLPEKKLHSQLRELLGELSLPEAHIGYLLQLVAQNVEDHIKERSSSSERVRRQLAGIDKRISNLEGKYIDGDIDKEAYFTWSKSLRQERGSIIHKLNELKQPANEIWSSFKAAIPFLGQLQWLYDRAGVEDKQGMIRAGFNNSLYYQDGIYRTTFLLPIFQQKALILKEKGLLIYEQPTCENENYPVSAPERS